MQFPAVRFPNVVAVRATRPRCTAEDRQFVQIGKMALDVGKIIENAWERERFCLGCLALDFVGPYLRS